MQIDLSVVEWSNLITPVTSILAIVTSVLALVAAVIIAKRYGDLAGTDRMIKHETERRERDRLEQERAAAHALNGELRRSRYLCDHNGALQDDKLGSFMHFPTSVAMEVAFTRSYMYPTMLPLREQIEKYLLGVMHINQLIDLHHQMWCAYEKSSGVYEGSTALRGKLRGMIARRCSGEEGYKVTTAAGSVVLPTDIDDIMRKLEQVIKEIESLVKRHLHIGN